MRRKMLEMWQSWSCGLQRFIILPSLTLPYLRGGLTPISAEAAVVGPMRIPEVPEG